MTEALLNVELVANVGQYLRVASHKLQNRFLRAS